MVPIHDALEFADVKSNAVCFQMALKAGMKYFPERFGFPFHEDDGINVCKMAFDKIGVEEAMNIIRRYIPPSDHHLKFYIMLSNMHLTW